MTPTVEQRGSRFEVTKWDQLFHGELDRRSAGSKPGFFWEYSERDKRRILGDVIEAEPAAAISLAELACGSALASMDLASGAKVARLTLLDGARGALDYARQFMPAAVVAKAELVQADLFDTGLPSGAFDISWNCGVIEHYQPDEIVAILREMARVTAPSGKIVVAIPNRRSLGVPTAALLGHRTLGRYLRWIPGYRNDTEILYSVRQIQALIHRATGTRARVCYAGSPAWTFCPRWLVRLTGWMGKPLGCSFLVFFVVDKR